MLANNWYEFGPVDFLEPDESVGEVTRDDILADLNKDDDEEVIEEEPKKEEKEEKEKEEEDEEKEGEEEKLEIDEDDDEDKKPKEDEAIEDILSPLSRKAVLKKYPTIFKEFPQLEKGYYGNIEYRKVFPSVKEAQAAAEKLDTFGVIENELRAGNSETLLKNIKSENEDNFTKVVDNYLPNLEKVDPPAYFHVIGNVIKRLCFAMAESSTESKDEDLLTAAKIVKGYMFGDKPIDGIKSFGKPVSREADELSNDRKKFNEERLSARQGEVKDKFNRIVINTLTKHMDPRDSMPSYVKKNAIRDANEMVTDLIGKDKEFTSFVKRMWDAAEKQNFSEESTGKIRSAYVSKAKTLLPQVIRKIRQEALKESGRGNGKDKDKDKGTKIVGTKSAPSGKEKDGKEDKKNGKGMSTLDFLNSD